MYRSNRGNIRLDLRTAQKRRDTQRFAWRVQTCTISRTRERMTSFSKALDDFQNGRSSIEDLEQHIDQDLDEGAAPADLLDALDDAHSSIAFDTSTLATLRTCIEKAGTRLRTRLKATTKRSAARVKVGDTIKDRFILEELIGRGGMSRVYKATDRRRVEAQSREPHVAVKIMSVDDEHVDQSFIAMQREVQKSQSLTHQNIVRVNDFDRDGDIVFTTMELLDGESLQQKIARTRGTPVTLDEVMHVIRGMCSALSFAHQNHILHADFKPSNVIVTRDGKVKVIDFGIARGLRRDDPGDQTLFDVEEALGAVTPSYASPEMLEDQESDPRDDVYGLGCVVYELLTGQHPFGRTTSVHARDHGLVPKKPANLGRTQWRALARALKFDRPSRTRTVDEFWREFEASASTGGHRSGKVWIGAAILIVAVAGGIVFLGLDRAPTSPAVPQATLTPAKDSTKPIAAGPVPDLQHRSERVFQDCTLCPSMRRVAAGTGQIGQAAQALPGFFESPPFEVIFDTDYAIALHEVTVGQFRAFVQSAGHNVSGCRTAATNFVEDSAYSWRNPGFAQTDDHPVVCVSWQDAKAYAAWLSEQAGATFRLGTEAEWEHAARTVGALSLDVKEAALCDHANVADESAGKQLDRMRTAACDDGFPFTAPVTRVATSERPVDMRGNVFEWVEDCWNADYTDAPRDGTARVTGQCELGVLRGGSWFSEPAAQRVTFRNRHSKEYRSNTIGFRVFRSL